MKKTPPSTPANTGLLVKKIVPILFLSVLVVAIFLLKPYYQSGKPVSDDLTGDLTDVTDQIVDDQEVGDGFRKIGSEYRGNFYLYNEPLEQMYSNDWWGRPTLAKIVAGESDYSEWKITAEGKSVEFSGMLRMNCADGQYEWSGVSNFREAVIGLEAINALIPVKVYENAKKVFCMK